MSGIWYSAVVNSFKGYLKATDEKHHEALVHCFGLFTSVDWDDLPIHEVLTEFHKVIENSLELHI